MLLLDYERIALEDLYTAFVLGGISISENPDLFFIEINEGRIKQIKYYLEKNNLNQYVHFEIIPTPTDQVQVIFELNLLARKLFSEWLTEGNITAISPAFLNTNVFLLWLSLFAEQRKNYIRISNGHFLDGAKNTLANIFKEHTGILMNTNIIQFTVHDVIGLIILAINSKRPVFEIYLFLQFISEREYHKLVQILNNPHLAKAGGNYCEYY